MAKKTYADPHKVWTIGRDRRQEAVPEEMRPEGFTELGSSVTLDRVPESVLAHRLPDAINPEPPVKWVGAAELGSLL